MRFDSVSEASADVFEILGDVAQRHGVPTDAEITAPEWLATGVTLAEKEDEYRIAIRIRQLENPLVAPFIESLRELFPGRELDIQFTGPVRIGRPVLPIAGAKKTELRIGVSVGHSSYLSAGTLGFFAKERGVMAAPTGFVSANHVIAQLDRGTPGTDEVLQPGRDDGGTRPTDSVAVLRKFVPLRGGGKKRVDCAFAELIDPNHPRDQSLLHAGRLRPDIAPLGPNDRRDVFKIGRTTDVTEGRIVAFIKTFSQPYSSIGKVEFIEQIEIESASIKDVFSDPGDSGALVYNGAFQAVGLLFGETAGGGTYMNGLAYVNRMDNVLGLLSVDLVT